jgi:ParB-like chromosome segregation protein Spo0J
MTTVLHVSPGRLVVDPARNPRFAGTKDPAKAARLFYASAEFKGLCRSFAASGIQLPLFVAKRKSMGYEVLEGFSRAHWAKLQAKAGKPIKVPIVVVPMGKDSQTTAVAMNTARVEYDPLARAASFAAMVDEWGSVENAAKRAGVNVAVVRESLRLLKLPRRAQRMIHVGKLSLNNALKITRLPGWKTWRKLQDGKTVTTSERRRAKAFESRLRDTLATLAKMDNAPDVGTQWNKTQKSRNVDLADVAVVLPTIVSLREACFTYGRKIARTYIGLQAGTTPISDDERARLKRWRVAIEHLGAAMGWCVPKALLSTLTTQDGTPLYTVKVADALCREIVNEYTLAGVLAIAHEEGRGFVPDDELLEDEKWQKFYRQDIPLAGLVRRLNRRLK